MFTGQWQAKDDPNVIVELMNKIKYEHYAGSYLLRQKSGLKIHVECCEIAVLSENMLVLSYASGRENPLSYNRLEK